MTRRTKANQAHSLISHYLKLYRERYESNPVINRYRDKWGFDAMIDDLGEYDSRRVMDYYFGMSIHGHPMQYLFKNYDRLYRIMVEREQDAERTRKLREETAKRVAEWEDRVDND